MSKEYYLFIPTQEEFHSVIAHLEKLSKKNKTRFQKSILFAKMIAFSGLRLAELFHFDFQKHILRDVGKYGSIKLSPVRCSCSHCERRKENYWYEYERKDNTTRKRYKKRLAGFWTPKSDESMKSVPLNKPMYDLIQGLRLEGYNKVQDIVGSYDTLAYQITKINKFLPENYPKRKKLTAHQLRRYYISQALDKYRDTTNVSRLARHRSPAVTKLYSRAIEGLGEDMTDEDL